MSHAPDATPDAPHEAQHAAIAAALPDLAQVPVDQRDRVWFDTYYQGDQQKQLTVRAVLMGMLLGGFMSLSNLYVGLKTGWGLGVAITSCILSYAIWQSLLKVGIAKDPMTILENNCMQSTATSAGTSTGGTMVSAIAAYLLITGQNMPFWTLFWWTVFLALLGVFMAVPMKRQMINREQLKFPSGIAAAVTLKSLHAAGEEAVIKARALFAAMGFGAAIKWMIAGMGALVPKFGWPAFLAIPEELPLPFSIGRRSAAAFGLSLPLDPIMMAAGGIVGMRTAASMAVGAVLVFGVIAPQLDEAQVFKEMKIADLTLQVRDLQARRAVAVATPRPSDAQVDVLRKTVVQAQGELNAASVRGSRLSLVRLYAVWTAQANLTTAEAALAGALRDPVAEVDQQLAKTNQKLQTAKDKGVEPGAMIRKWSLWTGSAMMVTAGLTAFAFQWRSIVGALSGVGALLRRRKPSDGDEVDPLSAIEVPSSWMIAGLGISGIGCIAIMNIEWNVPIYWGIIAVALSFLLSLVACRATGETDITPIGAMGKVTQLFYGVTIPQNATANLMTAGVTAGAAGAAADLLTDLKSGYLLGANPRKQFIAQALGIAAGAVVVVPVWYILVPNAAAIGAESKNFPAPAAEVWASVAKLLSQGLSSLHPTILTGMIVGSILGVALTLADQFLPAHIKKWLPSATGLGLACVITFADSMAFFIGAVIVWAWEKWRPVSAEQLAVPIASGIIAGESILGIAIALLQAKGIL